MLGILVILSISWVILRFAANRNLSVLGFSPALKRLAEFASGLTLAAMLCALCQLLEVSLSSSYWELNPTIEAKSVLNAFWWDVKSVITEELFFRGAFLFLLTEKFGVKSGVILSAIAFGVYHWFSMGLFGNIIPMIVVFIGTGLVGFVWAYAFDKTSSIALPFGMHLGWNFTFNTIFSKGPLGALLLIQHHEQELTGWPSLINLLAWLLVVPLIMFLYTKYMVKKHNT